MGPMNSITKKKLSKSIKKWYSENEHPWTGRHHSEKTKKKISISQKHQIEKNGHYWVGRVHTDNSRKKMSETRKKLGLAVGENNGMYGKTHTPKAIEKIFSHRKMNKLEESVSKVLSNAGYRYKFQFFISENDICKSYDFKLKNHNIIVEVDGDFWHGNPDTECHWKDSESVQENDKLKTKMAEHRGYKVVRIWESEFKKNNNLLLERIKSV
jgi:very-short-patch-repair endonuclease